MHRRRLPRQLRRVNLAGRTAGLELRLYPPPSMICIPSLTMYAVTELPNGFYPEHFIWQSPAWTMR